MLNMRLYAGVPVPMRITDYIWQTEGNNVNSHAVIAQYLSVSARPEFAGAQGIRFV